MSASQHNDSTRSAAGKGGRVAWLDDETDEPLIDDQAKRLGSFLEAMADGRIDPHELKAQEKRLVAVMKEVEPRLDAEMHERITTLLCELAAYTVMQTVSELAAAAPPRTRFRG